MKLTIEKMPCSSAMDTMRIGGFLDGELSELKSMEHKEAEEKLLVMLDDRNGRIGTGWACGYGVYGVWFDNEFAYVNVGKTCD